MIQAIQISISILTSIGIGTAIVFSFSSWLGKIWAARILQSESQQHRLDLERIKSNYELVSVNHRHKIELYKEASAPLIDLLIKVYSGNKLTQDDLLEFDRKRFATTAHLALFSSSQVFAKFNELIDYLVECIQSGNKLDFVKFRVYALATLSAMRQDIGLHTDELHYMGKF